MADFQQTKAAKSTQIRNMLILLGLALLSLVGLIYLSSDDSGHKEIEAVKTNFASPLDHIDAESVVLERTQKQLRDNDAKTKELQKQIESLKDTKKKSENVQLAADDLKKRLELLEKQVNSPSKPDMNASPSMLQGSQEFQGSFLPSVGQGRFQSEANGSASAGQGIREDVLNLPPNNDLEKRAPLKNPDTYVPAGTFAKAVMIGGADASTAVTSPENPNPMLFRIIENGTLPNHRKSHLKNCMVLAHVVGDISSERGEISIQRLSCTFQNNEIVDQPAHGWVFGSDGKFGIRGRPVWRESALLQRAFAAGALSGISDGLSQIYTSNSISAEGTVQTIDASKVFQVGAAKGVGKAMNRLADYNIQRAEQYHPVIQISAGAVVDVVFRDGFFLDGKSHENKDTAVGVYPNPSVIDHAPQFPQPISNEAQTLPLSSDAVKRIQERSKELGLQVTTQTTEG